MRHKILLLLVAVLFFNNVFAENEKIVKVNVEKATVYLQGAQLFSKSVFNLSQGYNKLVFEGVSGSLDVNSIQANGKGDFTILDVQFNSKYMDAVKQISANDKVKIYQQQLIMVDDSVENIAFDMGDVNNKKTALATEKNLLLNNRIMKGETKKDSLNLLKESLLFLREKLYNIDAELLKLQRIETKLTKQNNRLNQRKTDLENLINSNGETVTENAKLINQIIVSVLAEAPVQAQIGISYYCQNAGWLPQYELRANSDANKIQLKHLAQIYQTTGIDWANAELTLSTGNPNQNNILPTLSPFWIAYFQQYQQYNRKKTAELSKTPMTGATAAEKPMNDMEFDKVTSVDDEAKAKYASDFVKTNQNLLRTDYEIKLKYNIPSDGKQHVAMIQTKEVSSVYEFTAIPKLDRNAFLMAKIFNWEDLNLMQAQANIFFDGTYLGKTFINPTETNDTIQLNVGRDNGIVMERKLLKEKSKEKTLQGEKISTKTYQIIIRNTKNTNVVLNLLDQIPISNDITIKVQLMDAGNGNLDETTGQISWKLNLKSKEMKKIIFTYEVKSTAGKSLNS
jgi:uncharacterized protein (TIGR02231 family)